MVIIGFGMDRLGYSNGIGDWFINVVVLILLKIRDVFL